MRGLALGLALQLATAGAAWADEPPSPPAGHPPLPLAEGELYRAPAGGAVVLDLEAGRYQLELRRWYELKVGTAVEVASEQRLQGVVVGILAGVAVGLLMAAASR